jgi:uncharacterized OB-fold protein
VTILEATGSTGILEKRDQRPRTRVEPPSVLYGLPCADCGAYYPANLKACPVCGSVERVSPIGKRRIEGAKEFALFPRS